MSFIVFSYNATVLLIQPNPTQPMDGPNPCPSLLSPFPSRFHIIFRAASLAGVKRVWPDAGIAAVRRFLDMFLRPESYFNEKPLNVHRVKPPSKTQAYR